MEGVTAINAEHSHQTPTVLQESPVGPIASAIALRAVATRAELCHLLTIVQQRNHHQLGENIHDLTDTRSASVRNPVHQRAQGGSGVRPPPTMIDEVKCAPIGPVHHRPRIAGPRHTPGEIQPQSQPPYMTKHLALREHQYMIWSNVKIAVSQSHGTHTIAVGCVKRNQVRMGRNVTCRKCQVHISPIRKKEVLGRRCQAQIRLSMRGPTWMKRGRGNQQRTHLQKKRQYAKTSRACVRTKTAPDVKQNQTLMPIQRVHGKSLSCGLNATAVPSRYALDTEGFAIIIAQRARSTASSRTVESANPQHSYCAPKTPGSRGQYLRWQQLERLVIQQWTYLQ